MSFFKIKFNSVFPNSVLHFLKPASSIYPFQHTDLFWHLCSKHILKTLWQKEKIAHDRWTISLFTQCFQFNAIMFFHQFPYFAIDYFKVIYCRFVVCGKGLKRNSYHSWSFVYVRRPSVRPSVRLSPCIVCLCLEFV